MRVKGSMVLLLTAFLAGSAILILAPHRVGAQREVVTVPKAWGKVVGFGGVSGGILFEASDGTLRIIDQLGHVHLTIKRN